jgi:hypothetical protein
MKHLIPEFEKMRARYPRGFESSLVLPCLRRIQEDRGFVADEDIDGVVAYLGVPRIQVEEVLSFYGQFRQQADRPLPPAGLPQPVVLVARRRKDPRPLTQTARHRAGRDDRGRALHAHAPSSASPHAGRLRC